MKHDEIVKGLRRLLTDFEPYEIAGRDFIVAAISAIESQRWIPVTERLPDKEGYYDCTRKWPDDDEPHTQRCLFSEGRWSHMYVTAWRIPEAHMGDERP